MQFPSKCCSKKFQTSWVMLNAAGLVVHVLLLRSRNQLTFELSLTILKPCLDLMGSKKLWREGCWLDEKGKEKNLLNCKYEATFQPDGCTEPTCIATCFIHFGFGHRLDNVQLWNEHYLFVCLFVYCFCLWVSLECISKSEGISVYNKHNLASTDSFAKVVKVTEHTGLRCQACLILSECYLPDLPQWLGVWPHNSWF